MKLNDFTIWKGNFGLPTKVSDTESNFYEASVEPFTDKVLVKNWDGIDFDKVDGDYKTNFVFIPPGLLSSELKWDESRVTYYREQNFHIVEDYFFANIHRKNAVTLPSFGNRQLKTKLELRKYFSDIIGKNLFNSMESGKFTLIIDSHTELISKQFAETLIFLLEYVGLKNVCCLIYNTENFKHPKIISWDYFLYCFIRDVKPVFEMGKYYPLSELNIDYLSQYKKPKRYLSYNANLHGHRLYSALSLYKKNLDEYGLISLLNRSEVPKDELKSEMIQFLSYRNTNDYSGEDISDYDRSVVNLLDDYYSKFPITLDIDVDFLQGDDEIFKQRLRDKYVFTQEMESNINRIRSDRFITIEHHLDTYFSIISETSINNQHSDWDNDELVHICEKTLKGLASPHPFILFANDGVLKYLRSIGFETFPEMFDESYDDEKNTLKRFNIIFDEIEKLSKMNIDEIHQKFVNTLPKIKHNHELLLKFDREELLLNVLKEISNV
tara:strand:+ start:13140 stop:14627 length:1488 start_codon:yes stop_codon:yes gene_type:complete